jgi:hypothetical protein
MELGGGATFHFTLPTAAGILQLRATENVIARAAQFSLGRRAVLLPLGMRVRTPLSKGTGMLRFSDFNRGLMQTALSLTFLASIVPDSEKY